MDVLRASEQAGYIRSAGTIWGSDYDAVAFLNREELTEKVRRFLATVTDRQHIAERMRRPVLKRFTYAAVSRRLMEFIAADLSRSSEARAAA
jgi:spore maturation protein CgeB